MFRFSRYLVVYCAVICCTLFRKSIFLLRLRETICNCLCSSSPSSCFSAMLIRSIGEFGAKNYFTDHRTANAMHSFRDSVPLLKMHGFYQDAQKFEQLSIPIQVPSDTRRFTVCWYKQATSNVFKRVYCVCSKSKTLRNCLSSSSFLHHFSGRTGNSEQRNILRTIGQLVQLLWKDVSLVYSFVE